MTAAIGLPALPWPLNAPLVVIDVETTGRHPTVDRIVEIGLVKVQPDGTMTEWETYVDPECHIPAEATAVHNITDDMVKGAPRFRDIAGKLERGLRMVDFAGYNVRFDLRFLGAEFDRCGAKVSLAGRIYDVFDVYKEQHPRTLDAAVEQYLGRKRGTTHRALADVKDTFEVMHRQMLTLPGPTLEQHHREWNEAVPDGCLDVEGKFYWRNGEACINFSAHAGTPLREMDTGFLRWMLRGDFAEDTKNIVRDALAGKFPRKEHE